MNSAKSYLWFIGSLIVALIVMNVLLKALGKAPLIGGVAKKAKDLANGE